MQTAISKRTLCQRRKLLKEHYTRSENVLLPQANDYILKQLAGRQIAFPSGWQTHILQVKFWTLC